MQFVYKYLLLKFHGPAAMPVKNVIRRWVRQFGWDIRRFDAQTSEWARLAQQLRTHRINVVFDVGANIGQFALGLRDAGFTGRIISFEPSRVAHSQLCKAAKDDSSWTIAPQAALGSRDGAVTLNLAANSVSSSILPMLPTHLAAAPDSRYLGCEMVEMRRLDCIAMNFVSNTDRVFLKLDVQGYESEVLRGATDILRSMVVGLQLELSIIPLYDGEHLFRPMLEELEQQGFELWSLVPGFVEPESGRLLQVDAVLYRVDQRPECSSINRNQRCTSTLQL